MSLTYMLEAALEWMTNCISQRHILTDYFSISFICRFSEEYRGKLLLHGGNAIRYKEVIYFFPACTKRIHYYNFITKEENNIVIPFMQDNEEFVVSGVVKKDNKVWLFSANSSNSVFVLDMKENKITKAEALKFLKKEKHLRIAHLIVCC